MSRPDEWGAAGERATPQPYRAPERSRKPGPCGPGLHVVRDGEPTCICGEVEVAR